MTEEDKKWIYRHILSIIDVGYTGLELFITYNDFIDNEILSIYLGVSNSDEGLQYRDLIRQLSNIKK